MLAGSKTLISRVAAAARTALRGVPSGPDQGP